MLSIGTKFGLVWGGILLALSLLLPLPRAAGVFLGLCMLYSVWLAVVALLKGPYFWLAAGSLVCAGALGQYAGFLLVRGEEFSTGAPLFILVTGLCVGFLLDWIEYRRNPELWRRLNESVRRSSVFDLLLGRQIPGGSRVSGGRSS